jgi:hypothetical protein
MEQPIEVPWPVNSAPGARPHEGGGRLINCYAEPLGPAGPGKVVRRRTPGLITFAQSGTGVSALTGYRGSILVGGTLFVAFSGKLATVSPGGVVAVVPGTLSGTKRVTFARNNKTPTPDICCVTENGAFLVTSGSIAAWPDADLPQPNSVCFQDSYFFWTIGDRRAFASDINSTSVNSLSFTTIQSRSSDTLLRAIPYNGLVYFFCSSSTEAYQDAGAAVSAPAFPYLRASVIDRGLVGANAIAGWEDGFGKLFWAADDFGVYRMGGSGFSPEKVSPPDLDRLIEAQAKSDASLLEASCYVHSGHSIWAISSPTWTWEFNINTQQWNERLSTLAGLLQRWRGTGGVNAFGKWIMGSTITSDLVAVDTTTYKEENQTVLFRMESGPVQNFPNRTRVGSSDFNFVMGEGAPGSGSQNEQLPQVSISWSDDGGRTWSVPLMRSLGVLADGSVRVNASGLGQTGVVGRRWRVDVGDGVYVGFIGSTQFTSVRRN